MKLKPIAWIIAVCLILPMAFAMPFSIISNSQGLQMLEGSVKIYWVTDEKSDSKVLYGTESMDKTASGAVSSIDHIIYINSPEENKEYSYQMISCLADAVTCVQSEVLKFTYIKPDKIPPIVTIKPVPEKSYDANLDIEGNVNEEVTVRLTLNGENISESATLNGNFTLGITIKDGVNNIELEFKDKGNNTVKKSFRVTGDVTPIELISSNLNQLNETIEKKQTITGQVNKPFIEIIAEIGENIFKTTSDKDGYFSLEIELDTDQVISDITLKGVRGDNVIVELLKKAVTYFECKGGQGSWFRATISDFTPDVVTPELLINGIAQFGFKVDFQYAGLGNLVSVSQPFITTPPLNEEQQKKMHEELIGQPVVQCTDDNLHCYVLVNLREWQGTTQELYNSTKWAEVYGTKLMYLNLPLMATIVFNQEVNGNSSSKEQNVCWFFEMQVDAPIEIRPKKTLEWSIKQLNKTIDALEKMRQPIEKMKEPVFYGCAGAFGVNSIQQIITEVSCDLGDSQATAIAKATATANQRVCPPNSPDGCQGCLDKIWNARTTAQIEQWICDRIFCPSVPTLQKHAEEYIDPLTDLKSQCSNSAYIVSGGMASSANAGSESCKKEYMRAWDSAGLILDEYKRATGETSDFVSAMDEIMQKTQAMCPAVKEFPSQVLKVGDKEYYIDENKLVWIVDCYTPATETDEVIEFSYSHSCKKLQGPLEQVQIPDEIKKKINYEDPTKKEYSFDPTSGPYEALVGGCIPAIDGYLQQWQSISTAVKECFQNILITGEGTSGVCKAVLSQYVCDAVWDTVRCFGGGLATTTEETAKQNAENSKKNSIFVDASNAFNSVQKSVTDRYGQTSMFNVMFKQKKLIHSACMMFFGIGLTDGLDLSSMLSSNIGMPVLSSEGLVAPANRRFMTSNPINHGWATHVYHIGYALQAGADVSYSVSLVCSNDLSCGDTDYVNPTSGTPAGACDCYNSGTKVEKIVDQGQVKATEMINQEKYFKFEDKVRYDKVILEWIYLDNNGEEKIDRIEKHITLQGMNPPDYCSFSIVYNEYRCHTIAEAGKSYFAGSTYPIYPTGNVYSLGQQIKIAGTVLSEMDDANPVPKYLNMTITNHNGVIVSRAQEIIVASGAKKLEEMPFWPTLTEDMFAKKDGKIDCRDAFWTAELKLLNSEDLGDGQYGSSAGVVVSNGAQQIRKISFKVKCTTSSGENAPKITLAKFVGYDKEGHSTPYELGSVKENEEIYTGPNTPVKIVFNPITATGSGQVVIGLKIDDNAPVYSQSTSPGTLTYEWSPVLQVGEQQVDKLSFKLQFKIKDGQGLTSLYPLTPKTIVLIKGLPATS